MNKIIILIGIFGSSDQYMEDQTDDYCDRKSELLNEQCCFCGEVNDPDDMLKIESEYVCSDCQQSVLIEREYENIYDMHKEYKKKGYFN